MPYSTPLHEHAPFSDTLDAGSVTLITIIDPAFGLHNNQRVNDAPITVTELTARIKSRLEQDFAHVHLCGEVSRLIRHRSGHIYFTIKDEHAAIAAVIWRSTAARLHTVPVEGEAFAFFGSLSVYEPRGSYQLMVRQVKPLGAGRLAVEFERRKTEFARRGWFNSEHKRAIPPLPQHIGIVTSPTAAALQDVRKVLTTRPGWLDITVIPCLVQGTEAPASIMRALQQAQHICPDVILLVRGGGSLEDLWCFNDETVVRAIVDCRIPIVTGIGHEIDTTLADLAADLRAATPSNAAECVCPSRDSLRQRLVPVAKLATLLHQHLQRRQLQTTHTKHHLRQLWLRQSDQRHMHLSDKQQQLHYRMREHFSRLRQYLADMEKSLRMQEPGFQLKQRNQRLHQASIALRDAINSCLHLHMQQLNHHVTSFTAVAGRPLVQHRKNFAFLQQRLLFMRSLTDPSRQQLHEQKQLLQGLVQSRLQIQRQRLDMLCSQLHALGPAQVLARGYTLSCDAHGNIITRAAMLQSGQTIHTRFCDGSAISRIEHIRLEET